MGYSEDLAAIDRYIKSAPLNTSEARKLRDEWTRFYDGLGWSPSLEEYDAARNLRNRFNLANAITAADKAHVEVVMKSGMTTEEMAGGTDRRLLSGMYDEPLFSSSTRTTLGVAGLAIGLAVIAKKAWDISKVY